MLEQLITALITALNENTAALQGRAQTTLPLAETPATNVVAGDFTPPPDAKAAKAAAAAKAKADKKAADDKAAADKKAADEAAAADAAKNVTPTTTVQDIRNKAQEYLDYGDPDPATKTARTQVLRDYNKTLGQAKLGDTPADKIAEVMAKITELYDGVANSAV